MRIFQNHKKMVNVFQNIHKWVRKWEKQDAAYDPDCLLFVKEEGLRRNADFTDGFGNMTERGKSFLLWWHDKSVLPDYADQIEELTEKEGRLTEEEVAWIDEVREVVNEQMEVLTKAMTKIYRDREGQNLWLYNRRARNQMLMDRNNISDSGNNNGSDGRLNLLLGLWLKKERGKEKGLMRVQFEIK